MGPKKTVREGMKRKKTEFIALPRKEVPSNN